MKTIEEKAKAYDEAIEKAKYYYDEGKTLEYANDIVSDIFPELKESEDDIIRKELITHCRNIRCVTEEGAEGVAKWIDWLEKQSEHKSINKVEPKFKVGDTIRLKNGDGLEWTVEEVLNNGYYTIVCADRDDFIQLDDNWELVEQKPTWSEEDDKILKSIIINIENLQFSEDMQEKYHHIPNANKSYYQIKIDWLKSLKDRVQPNQEWSEEDKNKVNNLYVLLDQMVSFNMLSNKDATEFKDWLKSLRPQL